MSYVLTFVGGAMFGGLCGVVMMCCCVISRGEQTQGMSMDGM